MMGRLCVGGTRDGTWIEVAHGDRLVVQIMGEMPALRPGGGNIMPKIERENYTLLEFHTSPNEHFGIWAKNGLTHADVMRKLMDNYRPAAEKQRVEECPERHANREARKQEESWR